MTTPQWYVTAQWYTWQNERGHLHRTPTGPAHAKTFGTATTACGIPCDSWTKFWHLHYLETKSIETCLDCDLAIVHGPAITRSGTTQQAMSTRRRTSGATGSATA